MLSLKLPRLLNINQVPKGYREQGILCGYRPPCSSAADCLLSVFQMTNETLNIWTHFLPACVYLYVFMCAYVFRSVSTCMCAFICASLYVRVHVFTCAFIFKCLSVCFYVLTSVSMCMCPFICACFYVCAHVCAYLCVYLYFCVYLCMYLYFCACFGVFLEAERPRFSKASRTLAFVYPYLFDSIPLFYRFYLCAAESCTEAAILVHYKHTVFAFLTCFIFASHLPERLAPGHFDYIGHSHQVFHVCGITGTYFQMEAIMMDMAERHGRLLPASLPPSSLRPLASMGIGVAASLAVLGLCSVSLRFMPEP
ncbi:MPRGB protein, partial [Centropus bengalensis]|nr:MPRGB protein [Centropus bengalensis]